MNEFDKPFVDGFAAVAVILALITVLFGVRYPEITAALAEDKPDGPVLQKKYRERLWNTFNARLLPLLILAWAFALLPLPETLQVIRAVDFDPHHYDFIRAAWVATDATMVYFALWTSWLAYRLASTIRAAA